MKIYYIVLMVTFFLSGCTSKSEIGYSTDKGKSLVRSMGEEFLT